MKLRITLLIILTLLLGVAIGVLASAQLRHKRMRPVRMYASEHYFKEHLYKVVEPDSVQKVKLDAILKQYGEEFNEMNTGFRKDFESLMDRQWNDIKPVLNKEQIEKLEEIERIRRERMKEFRQRDNSEERDHRNGSQQERGRRPPGFRDSLPNPPDRRTDSL
jgi:hypothetical protein